MGNDVVKQDKATEMVKALESSFVDALPDFMKSKHFGRALLTAFRATPKLLQCDRSSIGLAVLTSAQLGLSIGVNGQAYLLPFKSECQLIIGYRGLMDIAYRSGKVESIVSEVVYEHDEFDYEMGLNQKLMHKPKLDGDRGRMICVYAIARLKDSNVPVFEVLTQDDVRKIRNASPSANSKYSPWSGDFESEMWRKSAIRRLAKKLPASVEMHEALQFENDQHERLVKAEVVDSTPDPLANLGRNAINNRNQDARPAASKPEITPPCAAWEELSGLINSDPDGIQSAIENAGIKYKKAMGNIACIEELKPEDQGSCSSVLSVYKEGN